MIFLLFMKDVSLFSLLRKHLLWSKLVKASNRIKQAMNNIDISAVFYNKMRE